MKITKYKVNYKIREKQSVVFSGLYCTKEDALKAIEKHSSEGSYLVAELGGKEEIKLFCVNCERDLKIGDEYILIDTYTRFCSDCYKENSFTYYTVCGEEVGDENNVEIFDEDYKEVAE